MSGEPDDDIADLERAIDSDPVAALPQLLERWRRTRSAALGEAIGLVRARIDATREREPPGALVDDRLQRWAALERSSRDDVVDELVRTLLDVPGAKLEPRLTALAAREPDPQIASGIVDALEKSFHKQGAMWHWFAEAHALVVRHGDARIAAKLDAKVATLPAVRPAGINRKNLWHKTAHELKRALTQLPVDDSDASQRLLAAARAALPPPPVAKDAAALLQNIYEHPADDLARQVYADALLEIGDPRGEFIQLQLARARGEGTAASRKREQVLLATWVEAWLGTIAPVVNKTGRVFERGFLHAAKIQQKSAAMAKAVIGAPEWSTVVELDVSSWGASTDVFTHPVLRSLRTLRGLNPYFMSSLSLDVERIGFLDTPWFTNFGYHQMIAHAARCTWRVRHLEVGPFWLRGSMLDEFWTTPFAQQLTSIAFLAPRSRAALTDDGPFLEAAARSPVPVVTVRHEPERDPDLRYQLERSPGSPHALTVTLRGNESLAPPETIVMELALALRPVVHVVTSIAIEGIANLETRTALERDVGPLRWLDRAKVPR